MPIFKVRAYDSNGDLKSFRKEAATEDELLRALGFEGYVPISLQLEKSKDGKKEIKSLKLEDQHLFCSMLSAFLLSGLSLTEVLRLLQRQTKDKRLQPVFSELRESVESGRSLAQSMKSQGVFQDFLVGMVESGERSSSLPAMPLQLSVGALTSVGWRDCSRYSPPTSAHWQAQAARPPVLPAPWRNSNVWR